MAPRWISSGPLHNANRPTQAAYKQLILGLTDSYSDTRIDHSNTDTSAGSASNTEVLKLFRPVAPLDTFKNSMAPHSTVEYADPLPLLTASPYPRYDTSHLT